ncbi:MAG: zincin-like metallopeptidase domain-containing protein [Gammaproteobacteria bacterium]|nr:zincin-like metallopeptidase domain-containing protein [Gammaproteobacteria bacterium]
MASNQDRVEAVGAQIAAAMADAIEGDPGQWTKSWNTLGASIPHNPVSGAVYSGMNRWVLAVAAIEFGYPTGSWATYRQWQSADCQVQRGNHGVYIVRAFEYRCCKDPDCERGSLCESRPRWGMRVHTVFNASQVEGEVPRDERFAEFTAPQWDHESITETFRAVGAEWRHDGGGRAFYSINADVIHTPVPEAFHSAGGYASTVAHEHVHWTGHSSRLSRPYFESVENAIAEGARAREELVAELGAVIVCNTLGLEHEPVANHAAYLKHWAQALRSEDGPAVIHAASTAATRAASFIVGGIEAHRSRDDNAEQSTPAAEQPTQQTPEGQLVLLPSPGPADAAGGATEAQEAARAASEPAEAAGRPSQAQQAAEAALVAQGVEPGPGFDIASREERLRVARRIMERAVSGCGSEAEAAAQIAALLDIGEGEVVETAPTRGRAMGMGL